MEKRRGVGGGLFTIRIEGFCGILVGRVRFLVLVTFYLENFLPSSNF